MRLDSKTLNDEYELLKKKYFLIAQSLGCGLWEYDIKAKRLTQLRKLEGKYSEENLIIDNYRETLKNWRIVYPDDWGIFDAYCDSMDSGDEEYQYDLRAMTDNDTFITLRYIGTAILDENGTPLYSIGTTFDVSGEVKKAEDWQEAVSRDSLTGVYNKGGFKNIVTDRMLFAGDSEHSALMVIDIDDFKYFNDTFGHLFGDNVLTHFSSELMSLFSDNGVVGRVGGDEFAVYYADYSNQSEVEEAALMLVESIRALTLNKTSTITTSVGVALYPQDGINYNELFEKADIALYNVKLNGKNNFAIYDSSQVSRSSAERNSIERKCCDHEESIDSDKTADTSLINRILGILERSDSTISVVDRILAEVGQYYELSRIYLCKVGEYSEDFDTVAVWADEEHHIGAFELEKKLAPKVRSIIKYSGRDSIFKCNSSYRPDFDPKYRMCCDDALSFVQCYLYSGSKVDAFLTYEDCYGPREWDATTVNTLSSVAKIISIYSSQLRGGGGISAFAGEQTKYISEIINSQDALIYAIRADNYELVYANNFAKYLNPNIDAKEKCYRQFFKKNAPCAHCPVKNLGSGVHEYTTEYYDKKQHSWSRITAKATENDDKEEIILLTCEDVTPYLAKLRAFDTETGLITVERFSAEMSDMITDEKRSAETKYVLFNLSIDNYFKLRSEKGVLFANELVKEAAHLINSGLHSNEMVTHWENGDFLVLACGKNFEETEKRLGNFLRSVAGMIHDKFKITIVWLYGVYRVRDDDVSATVCIDRVEIAKNEMKAKPRERTDTYHCLRYDDEMALKRNQDLYYQEHIAEAFEKDHLVTFLQAIVDARSEQICSVEALVRWVNERGRLILPNIFLPIFENSEIAAKIDLYMCKKVFRIINRWLREDKEILPISINVSKSSILFSDFPQELNKLASRYKIPPFLIKIELTERIFNDDLNRVTGTLLELRELGFSVSVDNFTNKYPLLNLLKILPLDEIKLSGDFFCFTEISDDNKKEIEEIIKPAKKAKLNVVAVEVKTKEQADYLRSIGCDALQGFAYYEPMNVAEFDDLARQ